MSAMRRERIPIRAKAVTAFLPGPALTDRSRILTLYSGTRLGFIMLSVRKTGPCFLRPGASLSSGPLTSSNATRRLIFQHLKASKNKLKFVAGCCHQPYEEIVLISVFAGYVPCHAT